MSKQQDEYFLSKAITLARQGMQNKQGGPFGALVVKNNEIIGEGVNQVTSTNDPTAHAEMVAIRAACHTLASFQLSGCTLYTSCEPCPMCLGAIYWARPARVVFAAGREDAAAAGFDDAFIYQELELPLSDRGLPIEQHLAESGAQLFREWLQQEDRVAY